MKMETLGEKARKLLANSLLPEVLRACMLLEIEELSVPINSKTIKEIIVHSEKNYLKAIRSNSNNNISIPIDDLIEFKNQYIAVDTWISFFEALNDKLFELNNKVEKIKTELEGIRKLDLHYKSELIVEKSKT